MAGAIHGIPGKPEGACATRDAANNHTTDQGMHGCALEITSVAIKRPTSIAPNSHPSRHEALPGRQATSQRINETNGGQRRRPYGYKKTPLPAPHKGCG